MASGDRKLDADGNRLLQDTGEQRLESDENDCCCGCWKKAVRCVCGPSTLPGGLGLAIDEDAPDPADILYVPCDLVTTPIVFIPPGLFIGTIDQNNCYSVGPNSDEVTELPPNITETTDLSNTFDSCADCCVAEEACCLPDGSCVDLTLAECSAQGGTSQGKGTACTDPDVDCVLTRACCFPNGACADIAPTQCFALGGTPQRKGSVCLDINCGDPCSHFQCENEPSIITSSYSGGGTVNVVFGGECEVPPFSGLGEKTGSQCEWSRVSNEGQFCEGLGDVLFIGFVALVPSLPFQPTDWRAGFTAKNSFTNDGVIVLFKRPCLGPEDGPFGVYTFSHTVQFGGGWTFDPAGVGEITIK